MRLVGLLWLACLLLSRARTDSGEVVFLQHFFQANEGSAWLWRPETASGAVWNFSSNLSSIDPCGEAWQGLSCSASKESCTQNGTSCHITALALEFYGIKGSFPSGLETLSDLSYLSFYGNMLTSSIPSAMFELTKMVVLDFEDNLLVGSLSDSIYNMTLLQALYVANNNFHGTISSHIGQLTQLKYYRLSGNSFSGSIPKEIGKLRNLTYLSFYRNFFTGTLPPEIGNCVLISDIEAFGNFFSGSLPGALFTQTVSLLNFEVNSNYLTGHLPSDLRHSKSLLKLMLSDNLFSGSFPLHTQNLTSLTTLRVEFNMFSGTIPSFIFKLQQLEFLTIHHNDLSGSIPIEVGCLTNLKILSFNINKFHGTLPVSLGNLVQLELLWTSQNSFTGQIPNELGKLVKLNSLLLYGNMHNGTIPSSFGNFSNVREFKLQDMKGSGIQGDGLQGFIPSELGSMTKVRILLLNNNHLSGSIPPSFGYLPKLFELDLSNNVLTGTIPRKIGNSSELEILSLNENQLNGQLPRMNTTTIKNLFVQGNNLQGEILDLFGEYSNMGLVHVDISDNLFSGTLPYDIFLIPNISTIALSGNCFSGYLPSSICFARNMQVLSINGLGVARKCPDVIKSVFSTDVILYNTMRGSIPECVWNLPNLRTLHATGNGFTGLIPELKNSSILKSIRIAHNYISGSIPLSLQERDEITDLDLSFNFIRGGYRSGIVNISANISLEVNRLSGDLQPSRLATSKEIHILRGNIFSCGSLPENDAHVELYSCGSEDLDIALYVWISVSGGLILVAGFIWFSTVIAPLRQEFNVLDFNFDFKETQIIRQITSYVQNYEFYFSYLETLENCTGSLFRIIKFYKELVRVSRFLCVLAVTCIVISCPIILLKLLDDDDNSNFKTHSRLYTWMFSLAYTTGLYAAIIIVAMWVVVFLTINVILLKLQQSAYIEEGRVRDSATSNSCQTPIVATHGVMEGMRGRMIGLVMLNLIIIGSVNYLYIRLLTGHTLSPSEVQILQFSLAIFKNIYSIFCVPMLCVSIKDYKKSIWVRIRIYVINTIIIPVLVVMRSSPKCMLGLFESAQSVGSVYWYQDCVSTSYDVSTGLSVCASYRYAEVDVVQVVPPYLYQFECSSELLTSYIPVFIYSYMFQILLPFGVIAVSCIPYSRLPKSLRNKFPGIFWPQFWTTRDSDLLSPQDREAVVADAAGVPTGRKLINIKSIVSLMMQHICVLVTFGLCSPILSLIVMSSVIVTSSLLRVVISRFVHYRLSCIKFESNPMRGSIEERDSGVTSIDGIRDELSDYALIAFSKEFNDITDMLLLCHRPILITSSFFFILVCFDLSGDDIGSERSLWVPIAYGSLCIFMLFTFQYALRRFVKKPLLDTTLYSLHASSQSMNIEIIEGTTLSPVCKELD